MRGYFVPHSIASGEDWEKERRSKIRAKHSRHPLISSPVFLETPPLPLVSDFLSTRRIRKMDSHLPGLSLATSPSARGSLSGTFLGFTLESTLPPGSAVGASLRGCQKRPPVLPPPAFPGQVAVQATASVTGGLSSGPQPTQPTGLLSEQAALSHRRRVTEHLKKTKRNFSFEAKNTFVSKEKKITPPLMKQAYWTGTFIFH